MKRAQRLDHFRDGLESSEKEHRARLAAAEAKLGEARSRLAELQRYRDEYLQGLGNRTASGIDATALRDYHAFVARLGEAVRQQSLLLSRTELECDFERQRWTRGRDPQPGGRQRGRALAAGRAGHRGRAEQRESDEWARQVEPAPEPGESMIKPEHRVHRRDACPPFRAARRSRVARPWGATARTAPSPTRWTPSGRATTRTPATGTPACRRAGNPRSPREALPVRCDCGAGAGIAPSPTSPTAPTRRPIRRWIPCSACARRRRVEPAPGFAACPTSRAANACVPRRPRQSSGRRSGGAGDAACDARRRIAAASRARQLGAWWR